VPARLRTADPTAVATAVDRFRSGSSERTDLQLLTKHLLAVLAQRHPGRAVEVRVPPYAVAQCISGTRHTRGTPPAVVETDPVTWISLALGDLAWDETVADGRVTASGERSDLGQVLPLT
jgi:hypothetical protein